MTGCIHCGDRQNTTLLKVRKDYEIIAHTETVCLECIERYRCTQCGEIDGTTQQYLFGYRFCVKCRPYFPRPKVSESLGTPSTLKKMFAASLIAWLEGGMVREEILRFDNGYVRLPAIKTFASAAKALEYWNYYTKTLPNDYKGRVRGLIRKLSAIIVNEISSHRPYNRRLQKWLQGQGTEYPREIVENNRNNNKKWDPIGKGTVR